MNERIKTIRINIFHLTGAEFGARLGLSQSSITNIECGRRAVTDRLIRDICKEFGVCEEWLRTGVGEPLLNNEDAALEYLRSHYLLTDNDMIILKNYLMAKPSTRKVFNDFLIEISNGIVLEKNE